MIAKVIWKAKKTLSGSVPLTASRPTGRPNFARSPMNGFEPEKARL